MSLPLATLTVGLDLDGVIIDHTATKLRLALEAGYNLSPHQTASEVMKSVLPHAVNRAIQKRIYSEEGLHSPPIPGAIKGIGALREAAVPLFIISRRDRTQGHDRFALTWLAAHSLGSYFTATGIVFVDTDREKDEKCQEFNVLVYLDDQLGVLKELNSVGYRVLLDPHGSYRELPVGMQKVASWEEFERLCLSLAT